MNFTGSLSLKEAANLLEISPATFRNWLRSGTIDYAGDLNQIPFVYLERLKQELATGKIPRLRKRASKISSPGQRTYRELLSNQRQQKQLLAFLKGYRALVGDSDKAVLFTLYLLQLVEKGFIRVSFQPSFSITVLRDPLRRELAAWEMAISGETLKKAMEMAGHLDKREDLLSFAYQFLLQHGAKHRSGSFFTPSSTVRACLTETLRSDDRVLDPCCGSGTFLVEVGRSLEQASGEKAWSQVFGVDIDPLVVRIARANLTLASDGRVDSLRQIICADFLTPGILSGEHRKPFDLIVTNPPWGSVINATQSAHYEKSFPEIRSGESFSYFLMASLTCLKEGGRLGFILPESILSVRRHRDIREYLSRHGIVTKVEVLERRFSGVFTRAIALHWKRSKRRRHALQSGSAWNLSKTDTSSHSLLESLERKGIFSLKNHADWALGIVTGDNARYLRNQPEPGFEPILRGRDVLHFLCRRPTCYIDKRRERFQQVAAETYYRHPAKLVYRFICKELVFAIEPQGLLSLNSANVLIPRLPGYSLQAVCGILNSVLMQHFYQHRFRAIKTLRSHLESLPFPAVHEEILQEIEKCVEILANGFDGQIYDRLNNLVFELYEMKPSQREFISQQTLLSPAFFGG